MLFKDYHMPLILNGTKTVTRRNHKYPRKVGKTYRTKRTYNQFRDVWIRITKAYQQRLGDMTDEDAQKEGGYTLKEFKVLWNQVNGPWDPDDVVWVYEFETVEKPPDPPEQNILNGYTDDKDQ